MNGQEQQAEAAQKEVNEDNAGKGEEEAQQEPQQEQPSAEEQLTAKLAETNDKYLRVAAEFDNYRRRTAQEKLEIVNMASVETIKGLLPVLDDCERAMAVLKDSADSEAAKEGTELIYHTLLAYLKS